MYSEVEGTRRLSKPEETVKGYWALYQCSCGNERWLACSIAARSKGCKRCAEINVGIRARKDPVDVLAGRRYGSTKNGARLRGLEFSITKEELFYLVKSPCHYCGIEGLPTPEHNRPHRTEERKEQLSKAIINGIDRLDSKIGYVMNNCVPCCRVCNQMKSALGKDEFIEQYRRIVAHKTK